MIIKSATILSGKDYLKYKFLLNEYIEGYDELELNYEENLKSYVANTKKIIEDVESKITTDLHHRLETSIDILFLVISEFWCGDAAYILPHLHSFVNRCDRMELSIVFRDKNLPLIDEFLTNGGRSIPKVIILNRETSEVLDSWGPRPTNIQNYVLESKAKNISFSEWWAHVKNYYKENNGADIHHELEEKIKAWIC